MCKKFKIILIIIISINILTAINTNFFIIKTLSVVSILFTLHNIFLVKKVDENAYEQKNILSI